MDIDPDDDGNIFIPVDQNSDSCDVSSMTTSGNEDFDYKFLSQFSSMSTSDREVLIEQFRQFVNREISSDACAFYLDMNNWPNLHRRNLGEAIGSYFDYGECKATRMPSMSLVQDTTIGEGLSVSPNSKFRKAWTISNSGSEQWPPGCCLKLVQGTQMCSTDRIMVEPLNPGQTAEIALDMLSPSDTGTYQSQWRMNTPTGISFGEVIWIIVAVEESGLMDVAQKLSDTYMTNGAEGDNATTSSCAGSHMKSPHSKPQTSALYNPFEVRSNSFSSHQTNGVKSVSDASFMNVHSSQSAAAGFIQALDSPKDFIKLSNGDEGTGTSTNGFNGMDGKVPIYSSMLKRPDLISSIEYPITTTAMLSTPSSGCICVPSAHHSSAPPPVPHCTPTDPSTLEQHIPQTGSEVSREHNFADLNRNSPTASASSSYAQVSDDSSMI